ncbi:splicing factor 1 [Rosa chinensis]|nr:splicing factor 1 [Rosa chinensis]
MSAKVDTSASGTGGQKVSKFAAKSGFVIPKNKLSGSLVPIFRGDKNVGASDHGGGESKKQVQRKTKWGADLTQDASVRKGRALAYQTRVDQITQQLKSGISEFGNNENVPSPSQDPDHISSTYQVDKEGAEQLELEKREAIGEILKLNPNYKAPADYKPLLKEATVPIPVNEYPTYNILGLIYGPEGDNQKQLEKETGAKIQVYGTKAETGEKAEIKQYAGSEIQAEYEKLYVHVSADTFEKVDAAVAVIELLVTSVSGNLSAVAKTALGDNNAQVPSQGQDSTTTDMVPTTMGDQGPVQPATGPTQTPPHVQFQYPGPFFSTGQPGSPMNLPGFTPMNSQRPILNNAAHPSTSPFNSTNLPSLFGPPPALFPQTQHLPPAVLQHTYMPQTSPGSLGAPRNFSMMASQPSSVQTHVSAPVTFLGNRPPTGQSNHPLESIPDWQLTPAGSSAGWSRPPASAGFSNNMHMAPNPLNHLNAAPTFTAVPQPQVGLPSTLPMPALAQPKPYMSPMSGSTPAPSPGIVTSLHPPQPPRVPSSVSGNVPNFSPIKPLTTPSPGDFTFQPHRPQNPTFQAVPQQSNQFSVHNAHPAGPMVRPQVPSLQLPVRQMTPQPGNQVLSRPQVGDQISQPSAHINAVQFARNSTAISVPPRLATFPDINPVAPRTSLLPMRQGNFNQAHQMPNLPSPLPPRPRGHIQIQHSYPAQLAPNQQFISNPFASGKSSNPGGHQLYDPFSPTSDSTARR